MNGETRPVSRKRSFMADQRGAVALEMPIVYLFLIVSLLLPLADVGIAGFQYISAWQALRAFGEFEWITILTPVSPRSGRHG